MPYIINLAIIFIGFCIAYFVIKTAVKHAILESSEDMQKMIANAALQSKNMQNWNKHSGN